MSEMRAAMYDRYGPPEVLYVGTLPKPTAGPGDVLVHAHASSVNGGEPLARTGKFRPVTAVVTPGLPKRVGVDFAGEVAALPVGTTAITALRDKAHLKPGERLLVRGGSGGVGSIAVQLGRLYGAHVTALARADHRDFVLDLGADEVLDYRTTNPTDLPPFDVILDTVGTQLSAYRRLLTASGRMVAVAFDTDNLRPSLSYLLASTIFVRKRVRFFSGNPKADLLAELTRLTNSGAIRPVVEAAYPLADIAKAHKALEAGGIRGKLVIQTV